MKRHASIVVCLLFPLTVTAEHLFEAGLRIGLAGYHAQCTYVATIPNWHAGVQLTYSYHSPTVFGVRTGLTVDRQQAGFGKTNYTDSYTTMDVENEPMEVNYSIGRLNEVYKTWSMGLPLQLALTWKHICLYVGPKIVMPLRISWQETAEDASLSVFYPLQNNLVQESYPIAASRSFAETQSGIKKTEIQWWLSAELCYDIALYATKRCKSYLSVGAYIDISIVPQKDEPSEQISLLTLSDTRDGLPLHRTMASIITANRQNKQLVWKYQPFNAGIKIAYRFAPYNPLKQNADKCNCYSLL